jgi:hypothetical protein
MAWYDDLPEAQTANPPAATAPGTVAPAAPAQPAAGSNWYDRLPEAQNATPGTDATTPAHPDSLLPAAPYDATDAAVHGLTLGLSDVGHGALTAGMRYLTGQTPGFDYSGAEEEIKRGREAYAAAHPVISTLANLGGGVAGPVGPAMTAIKAATPVGKLALSTLTGGLIGGTQGAADSATSVPAAVQGATTGAEVGAGVGAAIPPVAGIAGWVLPKLSTAAQTLRAASIQPTPGSAVGGIPGAVENLVANIPIVGAPIQAGRAAAREQLQTAVTDQADSFNRGAVDQALAHVGEKLNADTATGHDAIAEMQQKISSAYNQAVPTAGGALDDQASKALSGAVADAKLSLPGPQATQFENFVQTKVLGKVQGTTEADAAATLTAATTARQQAESALTTAQNQAMRTPGPGSDINLAKATQRLQQVSADEHQAQQQLQAVQAPGGAPFGTLSGQDFQDVDRQLGQEAHAYLKSPDPDQKKLGGAYLDLQGQMRGWLERVSPQNAADLQAANQAWRMAQPVQDAARRTNDPNGIFTTSHLIAASRAASTTPQFARGGALMQQYANDAEMQRGTLATAGRSLPAPSGAHSGGIQGMGVGGGLIGAELLEHVLQASPYTLAVAGLSYPAMMGAYSNAGRRAISGLLNAAGSVPPAIAPLGPAAAQLATPGLLNNPPGSYSITGGR